MGKSYKISFFQEQNLLTLTSEMENTNSYVNFLPSVDMNDIHFIFYDV
jgi:hypothetical protein